MSDVSPMVDRMLVGSSLQKQRSQMFPDPGPNLQAPSYSTTIVD